MATKYLDFEGGNDSNNGNSFANRFKTITSGATAGRIAPGDVIRVMASPDPTSTSVSGTWTSGKGAGTTNISSSTNASPISVTANAHGLATGDFVSIASHGTNTNANGFWEVTVTGSNTFTLNGSTGNGVGGATGTVRKRTNGVVKLASALNKTVAFTGNRGEGRTAFTASANITATLDTTLPVTNDAVDRLTVDAAFGTGLAAYKALGSTQDFSGYQQLSLWFRQVSGTLCQANDLTISLCSDTAGATPVSSFNLPALGRTGVWTRITVDLGAAMSASVQSVAITVNVDRGAQVFEFANAVACKAPSAADSLNLSSLIGTNESGEPWFGLSSITGTRLVLASDNGIVECNNTVTANRGYHSTFTGSRTVYKRETIKLPFPNAQNYTSDVTVQDTGSSGSPILFSGGWNRTNMSTQTGYTFIDRSSGDGSGFYSGNDFISIEKFGFVNMYIGAYFLNADQIEVSDCFGVGNLYSFHSTANSNYAGHGISVSDCISSGGGGEPFSFANAGLLLHNCTVIGGYSTAFRIQSAFVSSTGFLKVLNAGGTALSFESCDEAYVETVDIQDSNSNGIYATLCRSVVINTCDISACGHSISCNASELVIQSGSSSGSASTYVCFLSGAPTIVLKDFDYSESLLVSSGYFVRGRICTQNLNGSGKAKIFIGDKWGNIEQDSSVRHTASGYSWKFNLDNRFVSYGVPHNLEIAKAAVDSSGVVTAKLWVRRENTNVNLRFICRGGQIGGVASDVVATASASATTWEELTLTFTPSETGVVAFRVEVDTLASTGTAYIDDFSVSQ